MKRGILFFLVLGYFAFDGYAQKVYNDGSLIVFEAAGMPAGSYTRLLKPRTTDGTNSAQGANTAANIGSAVNNERIAYKFEIATDNVTAGNWLDAVNQCAGLPGGNWRLPTQRELQMIWIMHEKLKTFTGFNSFNAQYYWCATEASDAKSWCVEFKNGTTTTVSALTSYDVRCVRDF